MVIYLAIPVLVIIGLCVFSIEVGRRLEKMKGPVVIKEEVKVPVPDPLSEEENKRLAKIIEDKDRELEERGRLIEAKDRELQGQASLVETTLNENKKLLSRSREEFISKADDQKVEIVSAIKFKRRIAQLESELKKHKIKIPPLPVSYNVKSGK